MNSQKQDEKENSIDLNNQLNIIDLPFSQQSLNASLNMFDGRLGKVTEAISSPLSKLSFTPEIYISDALLNITGNIHKGMSQAAVAALQGLASTIQPLSISISEDVLRTLGQVNIGSLIPMQELVESFGLTKNLIDVPLYTNFQESISFFSTEYIREQQKFIDTIQKSMSRSAVAALQGLASTIEPVSRSISEDVLNMLGQITVGSLIPTQELVESFGLLTKNISSDVSLYTDFLESISSLSTEYNEEQLEINNVDEIDLDSSKLNEATLKPQLFLYEKLSLAIIHSIILGLWMILFISVQTRTLPDHLEETDVLNPPTMFFEDAKLLLKDVLSMWGVLNKIWSEHPLTLILLQVLLHTITNAINNNKPHSIRRNKDVFKIVEFMCDGDLNEEQKEALYEVLRYNFRYLSKGNVPIKNTPKVNSFTKGVLNKNQIVVLMDKKHEWCKVMFYDEYEVLEGWILSKYLRESR